MPPIFPLLRRGAVAAAVGGLLAVPAVAAGDSVPTRNVARAYLAEVVPDAAPAQLLGAQRGRAFVTSRSWVQDAARCRRTRVQVECRFTVRLRARQAGAFDPIRCRGEAWAKLRNGQPIGRFGDYRCRTVKR